MNEDLNSTPPVSSVSSVNADVLKALKYARLFLNSEDHDVSYVDDVIDKVEGRGLYASTSMGDVYVEKYGVQRHAFSSDWYRPSSCMCCSYKINHPVHQTPAPSFEEEK